eukprot:scaffold9421_cov23-Tisochrysis_lutea.AAC.1
MEARGREGGPEGARPQTFDAVGQPDGGGKGGNGALGCITTTASKFPKCHEVHRLHLVRALINAWCASAHLHASLQANEDMHLLGTVRQIAFTPQSLLLD